MSGMKIGRKYCDQAISGDGFDHAGLTAVMDFGGLY